MSIALISLLKGCDIRPATTKLVLVWMCEAASDDGAGVWKTADTLAEEASTTRRSVLSAWQQLEAAGLISRAGVRKVRGGSVIVWKINVDALQAITTRPKDARPRANPSPGENPSRRENKRRNPVKILHKPGENPSPKPLENLQINLTPAGADALARLLDAAASAPASAEEAKRLALDVEGFHDGRLIVGGRYSLDRFSRTLKAPLEASGLALALRPAEPSPIAENVIPLARAC